MPAKTLSIPAADLRPGHTLIDEAGPAQVRAIVPSEGQTAVAVEQIAGRPRQVSIRALDATAPVVVTARSHAYVHSQEHARDVQAARAIVSEHKGLLRPQAVDLAAGASVPLDSMAAALRQSEHAQEAAVLRKLPGLHVRIDPDKGLTLTEHPPGYTQGAAQTWKNLEEEARSRKMLMFAAQQSPTGTLQAHYRSAQTGEELGLVSRIDLQTGAARTAREKDIASAAPTLDTARQRADLGVQWRKTVELAAENADLRPDLPRAPQAQTSRLVSLDDRPSVTGKFEGIAPSSNPDRMLIVLRGPVQERVSVPKDVLTQIPESMRPGTPMALAKSPEKVLRVRVVREKGGADREIGLSP
ncbi:MAG: hypothetical protein ABT24_12105 [Thiomonas sp. SCN 64-16]|jgi:hypothetical protein|uniref:hypothetical protein n=1 Tax=Thiomonas sp. SCN 64-16 TaxID=1660151 RepID=UPI00086CDA37|nr:hypothetical protein [Thiomonas sp. SCN 64-16]ODU95486.1 MAG: hypothetical protein ABT24_12105 [Thiomonas sp. SCN 64-16]